MFRRQAGDLRVDPLSFAISRTTSSQTGVALSSALDVFNTTRTPEDEVPPRELRDEFSQVEALLSTTGRSIDLSRARVLVRVSGTGSADAVLYGAPVNDGGVCYFAAGLGADCDTALGAGGITYRIGRLVEDGPLVIYGLAEDGVEGVAFSVAGEMHSAKMGRNAFLLEVSDPVALATDVNFALVRKRSGEQEEVPIFGR